ncbi:MAG: hypothetical protein JW904_11215 [Spirochaetales bacterium]|nr:hypothetical protein [Spirochaetales bacterium]
MTTKKFSFPCIFLFCIASLFSDFVLTAETADFDSYMIQSRFVIPDFQAFLRIRNNEFEAGGIGHAWITVGTLRLKGLVRALYHPMGYSVRSSQYTEASEILLASGVEEKASLGISFSPLPGTFSVFAFRHGDDMYQAGSILRFFLFEDICTELLMSASYPPARENEAWYMQSFPYQGGLLLNAASRIALKKKGILMLFDLFYSGGETAAPGFSWTAVVDTVFSSVRFSCSAAGQTESYIQADGSQDDHAFTGQSAIDLNVFSILYFGVMYKKLFMKNTAPEYFFYSGTEELSARISADLINDDFAGVELWISFGEISEKKPLVLYHDTSSYSLGAKISVMQMFSFQAEARFLIENNRLRHEHTARLKFKTGTFSCSAGIKGKFGDAEAVCSGSLRCEVSDDWGRFFFSVESRNDISLSELRQIYSIADCFDCLMLKTGVTLRW